MRLKKSEDMYRSIAETSNDLIFVIGRDDQVEYVNTFASALINMPGEPDYWPTPHLFIFS